MLEGLDWRCVLIHTACQSIMVEVEVEVVASLYMQAAWTWAALA
jgi:hypothetical protein